MLLSMELFNAELVFSTYVDNTRVTTLKMRVESTVIEIRKVLKNENNNTFCRN